MSIHTVDDDKFETLLLLVKGKLPVPVAERTRSQKSGVVQFWRTKELFTLGNEESPMLYFIGRKVVKKSEVTGVVAKTFKETKLAGYKKPHDSDQKIQKVTSSNIRYRVHNAAFTNKASKSLLEHTTDSCITMLIWLT